MAQITTITTSRETEIAQTARLRLLAVSAEESIKNEKVKPFFEPPDTLYSMKDIHDAIPKHCFERNSLLSFGYMLRDFAMVFSLMWLAATFIPGIENNYLRKVVWVAYSFLQGCFFTGLWELAHECGHGALSPKKWINNSMGMLMHSFLLVPYHSWRFTHSTHHKTTNNIEKDIAFVPDIKEDWIAKRKSRDWFMKMLELVEDMPIAVMLELLGHQLIAWPVYLIINNFALPRMAAISWWKRSHFYFGGDGPNFKLANSKDIIISDLGIAAALSVLYASVQLFGKWNVMLLYGFPYLWTNHWILTITFLQHTDFSIPYYPTRTWTFLRGAASTVDRDFGFIGRVLFHGAIETHVLHHHASRIPFYHAIEATKAIRGVMGVHYQSDFETPYLWAFWKNRRACMFVEEVDKGSDIYFFSRESKQDAMKG
ncbi:hypothetical protein N0V93_004646 [Gnomoniopsis smithogilvyi]|uniref:Fatty acid desaturase domain-containing protein n=1 Tax=Gnomoniopsis smithogilvyi TaxID=1191159 RepID=A0A9W8YSS7_9PEZI|nr:hypothetical protein N0V93_004646 [Gnomoniopsis smithogilvyi]